MAARLLITLLALSSGCAPSGGAALPRAVHAVTEPTIEDASTFFATVTQVEIRDMQHPYLRWVVILKIDEVVSGASPGEHFWFAIHSPSREDIKVGERYKITAKKTGDGYEIVSRERR
jgi:hypothetical protein